MRNPFYYYEYLLRNIKSNNPIATTTARGARHS